MKLTLLGHSCFAVESGGYRVVLDPYYVESYPPLHTSANEVLCSHHHRDHDSVEAAELTPRWGSPFTVETVQAFHDDQGGALRGTNTIHVLAAEGLRVVHLGDLGHELSGEQLAPLRGCDTLLIPVGGFYTIDAETAKRVADAIAPRVIVPMHYRGEGFGFDELGTLDAFTALFAAEKVHFLKSDTFTLTAAEPRGVIVPQLENAEKTDGV